MAETCPIVLIHKSLNVSKHTMTLLRKRGLVPIVVERMDQVQVVEPAAMGGPDILRCAMRSLASAGYGDAKTFVTLMTAELVGDD